MPEYDVQHGGVPSLTAWSGAPFFRDAEAKQSRIWIDLDNTPHVPFFLPIVRALQARGHHVICTARDAFQVCDLAKAKGLEVTTIGRHYGKRMLAKAFGLVYRALQLLPLARKFRPDLALSHGSRSQLLLCNVLGVASAELTDYEHYRMPAITRPRWLIVPEVMADAVRHLGCRHVRTYPGIKEDVYVASFSPDPRLRSELGIQESHLVATVRPPATEAHYHNVASELLFERAMEYLVAGAAVRVILLPRNQTQVQWMVKRWPHWFSDEKVAIPKRALDGLNLLWHSDLLISGGGTMNREAAALGVPAYSLFRGTQGAVDRYLVSVGRLVMIASAQECEEKIVLRRRQRTSSYAPQASHALESIVGHIEQILSPGQPGNSAPKCCPNS